MLLWFVFYIELRNKVCLLLVFAGIMLQCCQTRCQCYLLVTLLRHVLVLLIQHAPLVVKCLQKLCPLKSGARASEAQYIQLPEHQLLHAIKTCFLFDELAGVYLSYTKPATGGKSFKGD